MTVAVLEDPAYPKLYGGAAEFWSYRGHEVILHGPYETGKTFAALTKFHALLCKYHGAQALMVRRTYKSLLASACVTYERKVLPVPPDDPTCPIVKYGGEKPDFYEYPNESRIWLGGLDKPDKFLSAEFDFIYINQAEEIELDSYEKLIGRATGRAGNAPYTQVMGDCNPAQPNHWILERASSGKLKLFQQRHEHNPMLYDQQTGEITEQGRVTINTLDALTGIRYQRGRLGLWVAAEGVIFDNFSLSENITELAEYNPDLPVLWGVDEGFVYGEGPGKASYHPRVFLLGQETAQGGVNVFAAYYQCGRLAEQSIAEVLSWPYKKAEVAYVDSAAGELKARIWESDITTVGATHRVSEGIKNVRRLIGDGHNVRLLHIHPRCVDLIRELQSYRYDDASKQADVGEPRPLKVDDHGVDALRYMCWHLRYGN